MTRALAEAFVTGGGEVVQEEAREIEGEEGGPTYVVTDKCRRKLNQLVIATGAFFRRWARQLAYNLPLDTERGYHLMLPKPGVELRVPLLSGDYRFGLVPTRVSFAGVSTEP